MSGTINSELLTPRGFGPIPKWSRAIRSSYLLSQFDSIAQQVDEEIAFERAWGLPCLAVRHERVVTVTMEIQSPVVYE